MFEVDSADMCARKFPLVSIGGWAEGPACTDTGARTPIGASGNWSERSACVSCANEGGHYFRYFSIRLYIIWRSGEYRKQSRKKCSGDSDLKWHKHSGLSAWPIVNLCWFNIDLPTLILVNKVFPSFVPLEKCLYIAGFISFFISILNSSRDLTWVCFGTEFHNLVVFGKNDSLNLSPLWGKGV